MEKDTVIIGDKIVNGEYFENMKKLQNTSNNNVENLRELQSKVDNTMKNAFKFNEYNNLENKLDEEIVKFLNTKDSDKGTIEINLNDFLVKFEDRYNFSLDDSGIEMSELQKSAVKLYGTVRNTLVTDVYPDGIPKSVRENIYNNIRKVIRTKKEQFDKYRETENKLFKELNVIKTRTKILDAKEYDNNYEALVDKIDIVKGNKKNIKSELDTLRKLGTDIIANKEYVSKHILHVKSLLACSVMISEMLKNNYTLEDLNNNQTFSDLPEYNEKIFELINSIINETKNVKNLEATVAEFSEIELDTQKYKTNMYVEMSKQVILMLTEMLEIKLVEPEVWSKYKGMNINEIPEEDKEKYEAAYKYVLNQAIGYITVILDNPNGRYTFTGSEAENLRFMLHFASGWLDKELLEQVNEMNRSIVDIKKSLLSRYIKSFYRLADVLYKESNELFEKVFVSLITSTTKIDGLYYVLVLL